MNRFQCGFCGLWFPPNLYIKLDYFLFDFSYIYQYIDNMLIDNTYSHTLVLKKKETIPNIFSNHVKKWDFFKTLFLQNRTYDKSDFIAVQFNIYMFNCCTNTPFYRDFGEFLHSDVKYILNYVYNFTVFFLSCRSFWMSNEKQSTILQYQQCVFEFIVSKIIIQIKRKGAYINKQPTKENLMVFFQNTDKTAFFRRNI